MFLVRTPAPRASCNEVCKSAGTCRTAYQVLSDAAHRRRYDALRAQVLSDAAHRRRYDAVRAQSGWGVRGMTPDGMHPFAAPSGAPRAWGAPSRAHRSPAAPRAQKKTTAKATKKKTTAKGTKKKTTAKGTKRKRWLLVPFSEKEDARKLGAWWDTDRRQWYAPPECAKEAKKELVRRWGKDPKVWIDVPYAEKEAAKAQGARWDPTKRRWYAPNGEPALVKQWGPGADV